MSIFESIANAREKARYWKASHIWSQKINAYLHNMVDKQFTLNLQLSLHTNNPDLVKKEEIYKTLDEYFEIYEKICNLPKPE